MKTALLFRNLPLYEIKSCTFAANFKIAFSYEETCRSTNYRELTKIS